MSKIQLTRFDSASARRVESSTVLADEHFEQTHDEGWTFFMHYIAVCAILVLAMAAVLDPFAVLVGVMLALMLGVAVWLSASLAEMFNEYINSGEDR